MISIVKDGLPLAVFDAVLQLDEETGGETSGYTREDNSRVTDHYVRNATRWALRVVQTDHPIGGPGLPGRGEDLRVVVESLLATGDTVSLVTDWGVLEPVVLVSAPHSRFNATLGSYQPALTFEQVRFATSATAILSDVGAVARTASGRRGGRTEDDAAGGNTERGRVQGQQGGTPPAVSALRAFGITVPGA